MIIKNTYRFFTLSLVCIGISAQAQKLNEVQDRGVAAPSKVKVDGKLTEWPAAFEAYNKATMVYYTIANDEKNLYLVVQSKDKTATNKIMRGGITLSINKEGKKKDEGVPSVTFPVVTSGAGGMRSIAQGMRPAGATMERGGQVRIEMNQNNMAEMMKRADSVMTEVNKRQIAQLKEIKVLGLNGITDSLISIYNEYGVKAMAAFDSTGVFTYELAVPLTALGLTPGSSPEFSYNLKLNGLQMSSMRVSGGPVGASGGADRVVVTTVVSGSGGGGMPAGMSDMMSMMSPTFLWGKYTLVKR